MGTFFTRALVLLRYCMKPESRLLELKNYMNISSLMNRNNFHFNPIKTYILLHSAQIIVSFI